jgi:hypothetical protein
MNEFINDFFGVIGNPAQTIARVMEKKRWQAALAVILLVAAVCTFLIYPISKADQARLIRDSDMAEKLSDEQLAGLDQYTPTGRIFGALVPIVFSGLAIVLAAFFIYLFYKVAGSEGLYVNYFSGVVHASLLDMVLGGILKCVLVMIKQTTMVHTGLTLFFPGLEIRSLPFIALSQFDFFSLWYLAALALGIAAYARISPKKSIFIAVLYFLFKSIVFIGFSYIMMKITGI